MKMVGSRAMAYSIFATIPLAQKRQRVSKLGQCPGLDRNRADDLPQSSEPLKPYLGRHQTALPRPLLRLREWPSPERDCKEDTSKRSEAASGVGRSERFGA